MGSFAFNAIADYVSKVEKAKVLAVTLGAQKTKRDRGRKGEGCQLVESAVVSMCTNTRIG